MPPLIASKGVVFSAGTSWHSEMRAALYHRNLLRAENRYPGRHHAAKQCVIYNVRLIAETAGDGQAESCSLPECRHPGVTES